MMREIVPNLYVRTSHIQKLQSVVFRAGDALYVVDPCYFPDEIAEIRELARNFEGDVAEKFVILTHSDFDHIAGVPDFSDYPVLAASTWDPMNEQGAIDQIERFDSEMYVDRGWLGKMPRVPIAHACQHGEQRGALTFYHAKGHTADGLVTIFEHTAIVGDYLSGVEFPFVYTSYRDYLQTLSMFRDVFLAHGIEHVISQHGPAALTASEIRHRLDTSEDYLHRAVSLVERGITRGLSLDEILAEILDDAGDFSYETKPIPLGIRRFHTNNVRRIYEEGV